MHWPLVNSWFVIIALTEVFDGTVPSKILFPFPWDPYLKTGGKSLHNLFLVNNFEEKEVEFLKEQFCQKLLSNNDNNWVINTNAKNENFNF